LNQFQINFIHTGNAVNFDERYQLDATIMIYHHK